MHICSFFGDANIVTDSVANSDTHAGTNSCTNHGCTYASRRNSFTNSVAHKYTHAGTNSRSNGTAERIHNVHG